MVKQFESLSARRAWIEIKTAETAKTSNADVALRKESVDRNKMMYSTRQDLAESLSARRAWIEITKLFKYCSGFSVALRKESVDRNYYRKRG